MHEFLRPPTFFHGRSRTVAIVVALAVSLAFGVAADEPKPEKAPADQAALLKQFVDELVPITPGKDPFPKDFLMGSADGPAAEQPAHRVSLNGPFSISKYETPQNLYESVMGENPSRWKGPRNSVEMLSWSEAVEFCTWITELLRSAKSIGEDEIRLPTEAEWEYCCRAGTTTAYSFGDEARLPADRDFQASLLDPFAWHKGNAAGNDPPVGALKPNPWGLYDMHGYLREFILDDWSDSYRGAPSDGRPLLSDDGEKARIVVRGGSWNDTYDLLRSSARMPFPRGGKADVVGFRCVRAPGERALILQPAQP